MTNKLLLYVLRTVVPALLQYFIKDNKVPSVTEGMVRDYEVKVGVPEVVRKQREIARELNKR